MPDGLEPSEEYGGTITVHILKDKEQPERVTCSSFNEAIQNVKREEESATATKIEDKDGDIVFSSAEMEIEDWEKAWEDANRSFSVDVEEYECPYDNLSCTSEDPCVQCQLDQVQERY